MKYVMGKLPSGNHVAGLEILQKNWQFSGNSSINKGFAIAMFDHIHVIYNIYIYIYMHVCIIIIYIYTHKYIYEE